MKHKLLLFSLICAMLCLTFSSVSFAETHIASYNAERIDFSTPPTENGENPVTRGEFCRYMCSVLSGKLNLSEADFGSGFSDVSPEHEYYNDIMTLQSMSIINGDGDGTFRPDDYINYTEAMVMLTHVFYSPEEAAPYAAYPHNYVSIAMSLGLTRGLSPLIIDDTVDLTSAYTMMNNLIGTIDIIGL